TPLGDPIEVGALAAVYAEGRPPQRPLVLGAAKANVGHLEPAAGMVGLVKALLALGHETIPPQPPLDALNPHVPWDTLPPRTAREAVPWPRASRPRRAAVSSFGLSGTNAHVVLEEAPRADERRELSPRSVHPIVLSAHDPAALDDAAARVLGVVERQPS